MSEPRKNHLNIDGGQAKDDEHVASYKPIPEADTEFRTSKASLHKSKEKVDEAEEKLLDKEDEAKIVTRVDMADAKYIVEDHRNGDAKIELDANKRQFSGLTKEELMRYADDPFWVRLRWAMFVLFWALWLCMLAGAVAIIVQAPKCAPPPPKAWYQEQALVDASDVELSELEGDFKLLQTSQVGGVFARAVCGADAYEVLDTPSCVDDFKQFVGKAKDAGLKVIVDLVANFVPNTHEWFALSENRSAGYEDYFIWGKPKGYKDTEPVPPNNWVSLNNEPAWEYSGVRKEFFLRQHGPGRADLNFSSPAVVLRLDAVLRTWMKAGAAGVRLENARELLVDRKLRDEVPRPATDPALAPAPAAPGLHDYAFYRHQHTTDQPELDGLLAHLSQVVDDNGQKPGANDTVFTIKESGWRAELHLLDRKLCLRPPSAAPLDVGAGVSAILNKTAGQLNKWPALQLTTSEPGAGGELAAFAYLLPATPVFSLQQIEEFNISGNELSKMAALRSDASVQHGYYASAEVPSRNTTDPLVAVSRWKAGHTGYVGVLNVAAVPLRANLSALPALPAALTVHHVSPAVASRTGYKNNVEVNSDDVSVPAWSTVVLSFVPKTQAEK